MYHDARVKLDAFQGETTHSNDYQKYTNDGREKYVWPKDRFESPQKPSAKFQRRDPESLIKWKEGVYIPFGLMIKPRPIIDTSPSDPVVRNMNPLDLGKENAIKTRPRLYITPAVSIDDAPNSMRTVVCDYMYTTDFKKAAKEAASGENTREIATSTLHFGCDPVKLRINTFPSLPPGWREKGRAWDNKQKRALVDPTETYWLKTGPEIKCGACSNPYKGAVPQEMKDEIATLIRLEKLRLAHDHLIAGYGGTRPLQSAGVPLSKTELPVEHPFLSTAQAINQRYLDDKRAL